MCLNAEFADFLQNSAVYVSFRHFPALKLSLGRQFYDPYFPTHYTHVTLVFWPILYLSTIYVYVLNSVSIFLICLVTVLPLFRASFESIKFACNNDVTLSTI